MIFPTPFFARNSVYRGPRNYFLMAKDPDFVAGQAIMNFDFRASGDGLFYHSVGVDGDILEYRNSITASAFQVLGMIRKLDLIFAYGRLIDDGDNSRCALFVSSDGARSFNRLPTAIDGAEGSSGYIAFEDAAIFGDQAVFLSSTGEIAYTSDGETVLTRPNPGFTGSLPRARSIAAGTSQVILAGINGQAYSYSTLAGSASLRDLGFGISTIEKVRSGNLVVAAGSGKISTAPLSDLSGWTPRLDPAPGPVDYLGYAGAKWFLAGVDSRWRSSDNGLAWDVPANNPTTEKRVRSAIEEAGRLILFMNDGQMAVTTDFSTWSDVENSGLAARDYIAINLN